MASVRLKKGSSHYFACFKMPARSTDAKGNPVYRRVQRSTGSSDRSRALQLAISYERAAVLAAEKRWTESAARNFLREISAVSGVSIGEVEGTEVFLKRWLDSRVSSLALRSRERYEQVVNQFIAFLGPRAPAPISEVTSKRVADFRDLETAAGKAPSTVNKSLLVLAQAFDEAKAQSLIETNPARGLNVKGERRRAEKRRAFTFAQFQALVAACEGEWRTILLVCGYTGARQQEAAKLRWNQIDLATARLTLERTKTGDEHWLPIHRSLLEHLRSLPAPKHPTDYVMPELAAKRRMGISNPFRRVILPKIGITQAYGDKPGKGRKLAEYSLHSLRHSLSTWLNAAGVSELMKNRIVGWENLEVSRGYTHTELTQAAAELAKVPEV